MYRETLIAASLANALEELRPALELSDEQVDQIWSTFDRTMSETLSGVPPSSTITVSTKPPGNASKNMGRLPSALLKERGEGEVGGASPSPAAPGAAVESSLSTVAHLATPDIQFPLYRIHDGVWTIVLKDPTVTIQTGRRSETIQLDYLKCYIRDASQLSRKRARRE